MPDYKYSAIDKNSKKITGTLMSDSPKQLFDYVSSRGQYLIDYKIVKKQKHSKYVFKDNESGEFSAQISAMLFSGLSIREALEVLIKRTSKAKVKEIYKDIYRSLSKGLTLSEALKEQGNTFPELLINMYKSAEESGNLAQVSKKVAVKYTSQYQVNSKVKSALLYPKLLGIITFFVVIFLFTVIMPKLFTLFDGIELPLPTKIIVGISNFILQKWYILILAIVALVILIIVLRKNSTVRYNIDKFKVSAPVIGKLNKIIYTSRFARTLSSLFSSGISIDKSLFICKDVIGNEYIKIQFDNLIRKVQSGELLSKVIEEIDGFDIKIVLSINVGQESGKLTEMLEDTADSYDDEDQIATTKLIGIMEPLIIVLMAIVIGFIALSIMLPIMSVYNNVR